MIKKNKILLVINCLQGGGAERSVLTLGQGFHDLGFEVHILRFNPTVAYELNEGINYHLINYKSFKVLPNKKLRFFILAKVMDSYVKNNIGTPLLTLSNLDRADRIMRYSRLSNVAHIIRNTISKKIEIMSQTDNQWSVKQIKDVYAHNPCVCISKGVEADFRRTLGLTNTTTIYNPIDQQQITKLAMASIEDAMVLGSYVVHVGSFKAQKAHDVLIKAYAKTQMTIPLVLIGKGKLMQSMQALADSLGIADKVIFLGFRKNPYPYIKNAKFMVLSSNFEGFGRVIVESIVVGTPVISTDCPSGPSELLPFKNLVPVGDIEALTQKMSEAMRDASQFKVEFDNKFLPTNVAKAYLEFMVNDL